MKKTIGKASAIHVGIIILSIGLVACGNQQGSVKGLRVGYAASPLLGQLFAYGEEHSAVSLERFAGSAEVGYALLAGSVDAGFVEPSKALLLRFMPGFENLSVAGKIEFPYGAVLVLRKGLDARLGDLAGLTVGASAPTCKLLEAFRADARRLGVDPEAIRYTYLPFDTMLPALESGTIDGALVKGSYAALAQGAGHSVLYQQWDLEAGDACCPAVIAQLEYLLLVRSKSDAAKAFAENLLAASAYGGGRLRGAAAKATNISLAVLEALPLPEYTLADQDLLALFAEHSGEDHDETHDKHEGEDN